MTLIERLDWLATYLRDESLVYNDKAFGLHDELKKAAQHLRKLEAVREAGQRASTLHGHHEIGTCMCPDCDLHLALAACGDE